MGIHHIAIMASGKGSNAKAILEYFEHINNIKVSFLLTNKSDSGIPALSEAFEVPYYVFSNEEFKNESIILKQLHLHKVDFIVLAGFLRLIPAYLINAYPNKILNIHPALLPKYGGKGMYGNLVHQAVWKNKEEKSGITIHLVNEAYDDGQIIFQKEISIANCSSPEAISESVLEIEHQYYPKKIAEYILNFKES
jgi:phosphoribosylglycinamide formyltransferase-1